MDMATLNRVLEVGVEQGASDIHFRPGAPPLFRVNGELLAAQCDSLKPQHTSFIAAALQERVKDASSLDELQEYDTSYSLPGISRFRANIYRQRGSLGIILRIIPRDVPSIETLKLPGLLKTVAAYKRGLVLVTGATGAGKSTTLAAMVNEINLTRCSHIITIEDPLEYLHSNKRSSISQREIGIDTRNYVTGLRAALRQDPDVILLGEMRDTESVDIALKASETGHLVLSTMHTSDATRTINRLISYFPSEEQLSVRHRVSENLKACLAQRLLPCSDGNGQCVAMEMMIASPTIQAFIYEDRPSGSLDELIDEGEHPYGMQSFDKNIMELFQQGRINLDTAVRNASRPDDFKRSLIYE